MCFQINILFARKNSFSIGNVSYVVLTEEFPLGQQAYIAAMRMPKYRLTIVYNQEPGKLRKHVVNGKMT